MSPVVAADLVFYASLNMPEDDVSPYGGAIDLTTRVTFPDVTSAPKRLKVRAASDDVDMRGKLVTVVTRTASGVEETFAAVALDGSDATTPVDIDGSNTKQSVQSFSYDAAQTPADPDVDLILEDDSAVEVARIYAGEMAVLRLFRQAFSDTGAKDYYEKVFAKNNSADTALLEAQVVESADPTGLVTFQIADSKDDSDPTSADRLTKQSTSYLLGGSGSFTNAAKSVPTGSLDFGEAIGVYLELALAGGQSPLENSYTPQLTGKTA